ncbi:hypothetical protein ACTUVN_002661 [Pseudomonas caspiana]
MNDYSMKYVPGTANCLHVYRPGADAPAFMVRNEAEANRLIKVDRAHPEPLNRCVGCVKEECPCLPV